MVRLHLDVLEPVFAHLHGSDLVYSALVSRHFLAAALPAIYAVIEVTLHNAKRRIQSPFATLVAHHHLAVHVRRIAIHAAPVTAHVPSPVFIDNLARAISLATNLRAFVCTVHILPPLLRPLVQKRSLAHFRISANAGARQLAVLREMSGLYSLALDFPSWHVIDALPQWTASMHRTLAHLSLFMSHDLDATMFNDVLAQLPRLRGLHVVNCSRITHAAVLTALAHTPDLVELSFTIFPSQENSLPPLNFVIPPLTHLSIDVRASYPALKSFVAQIIARLSPREALAVCGGWLGEIKSTAESSTSNGPQETASSANNQDDDLFLLSPPHLHNPNQANEAPHIGFSFGYLPGNHNGDGNNSPPNPPNPPSPEPNLFPFVASLPLTLTVLHLPLVSPGALKEIVERCQDIQLLGIVLGPGFASPSKSGRVQSNTYSLAGVRPEITLLTSILPRARANTRSLVGVRPEITLLTSILTRARALRELILDTSITDIAGSDTSRDTHEGFRSSALLTPIYVRTLMREVPLLRRVVGEGRVWESSTPTPTGRVPILQSVTIDLTASRAPSGPGASGHHAHSPPGFGTPGGGYAQVEIKNDHWFWLRGSASGGEVYRRF